MSKDINFFRQEDFGNITSAIETLLDEVSKLSNSPNHIVLTNAEVAEKLGVSTRQLYRWRQNGIIKYSQIGREIFYRLSDILEMLDRYSVKAIH